MRHITLLLACLLALSAHALTVHDLTTQGYHNPIGIDLQTAQLSWQLSADERATVQQTYAIRISTTRDMATTVWESGTITSAQTLDVKAEGFTPQPRTRYYWQVTVTDNHGQEATSQETAYFETGLYDDWSGTQWIKATTQRRDAAPTARDYEVEVEFEIADVAAGLIFAASDHANYYMWQVNTFSATPTLRPHQWTNGNAACLDEKPLTVALHNGERHTLRIEVRDARTATTYIDGTQVDEREGDFAYGDFGFREDYGWSNGAVPEKAYFDNFRVTSHGETLLADDFTTERSTLFTAATTDGRLYIEGAGAYVWQQSAAVHYDVDVDLTLIHDNAAVCFAATADNTYMMWAINTLDGEQPLLRRHIYAAGSLTTADIPITAFTKSELLSHPHHLKIAAQTPLIKTYLDDQLIDTYTDDASQLTLGDVGLRVSSQWSERERAYFDNLTVTIYEADGTTYTSLSEDFEGDACLFTGGEIKDYDGSHQLYLEAPTGTDMRLMQNEGSVIPGAPMLRKTFTAQKPIRAARLYATGLGIYNVYINGQRVGIVHDDGTTEQDELKPGFTDYHYTVFYTTHDVATLLHEGRNAIGAELTSGWWNGNIAHGLFGNKPLAFRARLVLTYDDGTEETIGTDPTWTAHTNGPLRKGDIYNGETYDARLESPWATADYDDTQWYATAPMDGFEGTIRAFEGPAVKAVPEWARSPKTITVYEGTDANGTSYGKIHAIAQTTGESSLTLHKGQTAVIDFGQNAAGWVSFKAQGARSTALRFRHAEMLNTSGKSERGDDGPEGSIYRANLRSAEAALYYTLRGDDEGERFHPTTTFYGFQYVEITASDDVLLTDITAETVTSRMDERSTLTTSHPDVNQLISNIRWGQRSNFLSIPTDCPQRDERQGWTADTQVYSMAAMYNADARTFYEKWMRDMRDSQRPDGAYPCVAPYTWFDGYGIAAWSCAGVILPYKVYLMTGDTRIINDNWDSMTRYMQYLATQEADGYKYNGGAPVFGDWLSFADTDSRYCSVCYYAYDAQLMAKMARATGRSEEATAYDTLFDAIRTEWQARYTVSTTGVPKIRTQCAYLMALRYNLLRDEPTRTRTIAALKNAITGNAYTLNTGFLGTAIINQTLTEAGLNDEAYTLLLQRNCPSWLYSVDQGATTVWERWNSYTKADGFGPVSMNSYNHYSYGIVLEWMYRHMAGIVPDPSRPGFQHFILEPHPDTRKTLRYQQQRITQVDADFYSVSGEIRAAWQLDDAKNITYNVTVPANTTATLRMPVAKGKALYEGGKPIREAEGISDIEESDGLTQCTLGSGTYTFTVDVPDAINRPKTEAAKARTYSVSGLYLGERPTLSRGIYITDGRKKIVK